MLFGKITKWFKGPERDIADAYQNLGDRIAKNMGWTQDEAKEWLRETPSNFLFLSLIAHLLDKIDKLEGRDAADWWK